MFAKVKLIANSSEMDKAEKMGIDCPPKFEYGQFVFNPKDVRMSYVNLRNEIVIYLNGEVFVLPFEQTIWDAISKSINNS